MCVVVCWCCTCVFDIMLCFVVVLLLLYVCVFMVCLHCVVCMCIVLL